MKAMNATKLSTKHNINDYLRMETEHDKAGIAAMIGLRLRERYVRPVESASAKNGFASLPLKAQRTSPS